MPLAQGEASVVMCMLFLFHSLSLCLCGISSAVIINNGENKCQRNKNVSKWDGCWVMRCDAMPEANKLSSELHHDPSFARQTQTLETLKC